MLDSLCSRDTVCSRPILVTGMSLQLDNKLFKGRAHSSFTFASQGLEWPLVQNCCSLGIELINEVNLCKLFEGNELGTKSEKEDMVWMGIKKWGSGK